jgi:intracellular multiplication protein IcmO
MVPAGAAYVSYMYPTLAPVILPSAVLLSSFNLKAPISFPAFVPESSGQKVDPNLIVKGEESKLSRPEGITCIGVDRKTGLQVWLTSDYDRRHHKTIATTGAGKTHGLMFKIMMSLIQTTGTVVIDGKGDEDFPKEVWSMLRRFGREQDFRLLNFKQGSEDKYYKDHLPLSNTFNPFSKAPRSAIAEILKSLLSQDGTEKSGDFWAQRANVFVDLLALLSAYLRDHFGQPIRVGTIRELLDLRKLIEFYTDERIPTEYKEGLESYLKSIQIDIKDVQEYAEGADFKGKIVEQHSYVSMQLQPALSVLADDYGYIFDTDSPDIDMDDIAVNNRVLFCLLPALQKAPATTQNTGRIILAALKGMISSQLGDGLEGNTKQQKRAKPMADAAPFHVRLDESGYYAAIDGIQQLPAQARGLGFSFDFIAQTFLDWTAAGGKVAEIIWGNTNNTQVGKIEDDETFEKLNKRIGQRVVLEQSSIGVRPNSLGIIERSLPGQLTVQKKDVVEFNDFTQLREGQFKQVFDKKVIDIFVGDPKVPNKTKEIRLNHFCNLSDYSETEVLLQEFDYTPFKKIFTENLSQKQSKFNRRIKLQPNSTKLMEQAQTQRVKQSSQLNIDQWQKLLHSIAEEKRNLDKEAQDETRNMALDFARSIKKERLSKSKPPSSREVKTESAQMTEESLNWFGSHSGDLDIDMDNAPTKSAALQSWQDYELDTADESVLPVAVDNPESALDTFNSDFDSDLNSSIEVKLDTEIAQEESTVTNDPEIDTLQPEVVDSESESIDEALDKVGLDFGEVENDEGDEDSSGASHRQVEAPQMQLEFPGVEFDGQTSEDMPAKDYPPKNSLTDTRQIKDVVKENIAKMSTILDIDL